MTPLQQIHFESRIIDGPVGMCWHWSGTLDKNGYGVFTIKRKQFYAHRKSYELYVGKIPSGKCVLHHCDNPICVNPKHLWIGSKGDNNTDRKNKGRNAKNVVYPNRKGEASYTHKLTEKDVHNIRKSNLNGVKCAAVYGVTSALIYAIRHRRIWKHI